MRPRTALLGTVLALLVAAPIFGLGRAVANADDSDDGRGSGDAVTATD